MQTQAPRWPSPKSARCWHKFTYCASRWAPKWAIRSQAPAKGSPTTILSSRAVDTAARPEFWLLAAGTGLVEVGPAALAGWRMQLDPHEARPQTAAVTRDWAYFPDPGQNSWPLEVSRAGTGVGGYETIFSMLQRAHDRSPPDFLKGRVGLRVVFSERCAHQLVARDEKAKGSPAEMARILFREIHMRPDVERMLHHVTLDLEGALAIEHAPEFYKPVSDAVHSLGLPLYLRLARENSWDAAPEALAAAVFERAGADGLGLSFRSSVESERVPNAGDLEQQEQRVRRLREAIDALRRPRGLDTLIVGGAAWTAGHKTCLREAGADLIEEAASFVLRGWSND